MVNKEKLRVLQQAVRDVRIPEELGMRDISYEKIARRVRDMRKFEEELIRGESRPYHMSFLG